MICASSYSVQILDALVSLHRSHTSDINHHSHTPTPQRAWISQFSLHELPNFRLPSDLREWFGVAFHVCCVIPDHQVGPFDSRNTG